MDWVTEVSIWLQRRGMGQAESDAPFKLSAYSFIVPNWWASFIHNDQALWNRMMVGLQMPYPWDPETAAAVDAAIENYVMPWEMVEESGELTR